MFMRVKVNGEEKEVKQELNILELLAELGVDADTVVVERNREIYSADDFSRVSLAANDELEIVRFMGGG
jgi:thiamine biosynthesis protein ThiS